MIAAKNTDPVPTAIWQPTNSLQTSLCSQPRIQSTSRQENHRLPPSSTAIKGNYRELIRRRIADGAPSCELQALPL